MQKSLRSLVLVATISLTATRSLHAGVMGTDPRPTVATHSITQSLLHFFGF